MSNKVQMLKVSVIIPCYNCEKYIAATIESVLNQSYSNIEIVCIDNNSRDGTHSILEHYRTKYPLRVVLGAESKQNGSAARNRGLQMSKGDVIQFLDSDDFITPLKIEKQIKILIENDLDLVVSDRIVFDESLSTEVRRYSYPKIENDFLNFSIHDIITSGNPIYRKSIVARIGGYDITLPSSQDWDFHLRLALDDIKIGYCEGWFFWMRTVPNSLSSNWKKTTITSAEVLIKLKNDLLTKKKLLSIKSIEKICHVFYNSVIYTENEMRKNVYQNELIFWSKTSLSFLSWPKRFFVKIVGLSALIKLERWKKNL